MELKNIPAKIVSGQHATWTIRLFDYSPDEWTLTYHVRGAAAADATGTESETCPGAFDVDLKAVSVDDMDETPLPAGQYFWQAYATKISDTTIKDLVASGRVEVLTDLSTQTGAYDGRTQNEVIWQAIKDMLAKKATRDQQSFTIGQRTIARIPFDQLVEFEKYYAKLVLADRRRDKVANGESPFETIFTQFTEPK